MHLTKSERLSLIFQMKILEKLYPEEAAQFSQNRIALEEGFTLHYEWLFESLRDEMSEEDCQEVLDILDMYRAITFSLQKFDGADDLKKHRLAKFKGFDGNNEGQRMDYVRYFIVELERYDELKQGKLPTFNSHTRMLPTYQKMLQRWDETGRSFEMSREQISIVFGAD